MKPDVIVAWPSNCDYPLWRQFIRDERDRFGDVIVAFTEHDGPTMTLFVRSVLEDATFIDTTVWDSDWRSAAVNAALNRSRSEWVWFTEQEFFITDPDLFWSQVTEEGVGTGWHENGEKRWHPSCLFARRDAIDGTSRDFAPTAQYGDHFARFTAELEEQGPIRELTGGFEHLQGLSQNHYLIDSGIVEGRFHEDRLRRYFEDCLRADVPLDRGWVERVEGYVYAPSA